MRVRSIFSLVVPLPARVLLCDVADLHIGNIFGDPYASGRCICESCGEPVKLVDGPIGPTWRRVTSEDDEPPNMCCGYSA